MRNHCNELVKRDRVAFQVQLTNLAMNNQKAFYRCVSQRTKSRKCVSPSLVNKRMTSNATETANALSAFYASVFTIDDNNTEDIRNDDPSPFSFDFLNISTIDDKLKKLNTCKSPGHDEIPPCF